MDRKLLTLRLPREQRRALKRLAAQRDRRRPPVEELEAEVKTLKAAMAACEDRIDEGKSKISALKRQRPTMLAAVVLGECPEEESTNLRNARQSPGKSWPSPFCRNGFRRGENSSEYRFLSIKNDD